MRVNIIAKNILIINGHNHSKTGGTEKYTYKLINIFTNLGHNVFELNEESYKLNYDFKNYENISHKIKSVNKIKKKLMLFYFILNALKFNLLIHSILKNKKIDIIIDNTIYTPYKFFKSKIKKKLIWVLHNDIFKTWKEENNFLKKLKMFFTFRMNRFNYNKIIVFTENDKKWLVKKNKKLIPENILFCPLSHKKYDELNNFNFDEKAKRSKNIVWIGRLDQNEKNLKFLKEIAEKINYIDHSVFINIYGDGPDKDIICNVSNIKYHGYLNKNEINNVLKDAKLLILPSYYEGFPYVVVEALSSGVPCFVSNTFNNASYLINEERGKCINNFDNSFWASEIIHFNNLSTQEFLVFCKNSIDFAKKNLIIEHFEEFWKKAILDVK